MCGKGGFTQSSKATTLPNYQHFSYIFIFKLHITRSTSSHIQQAKQSLQALKPHLQPIYIPTGSLPLHQSTYMPTNNLKMAILSTTEIITKATNAYKEAKQKVLK